MSVEAKKDLLFITEPSISFTTKSIIQTLNQNGYEVDSHSIADLSAAVSKPLPDLIILQAEVFIDKPSSITNKLYSAIVEQNKQLILMGYPTEINEIKASIPKANFLGTLVRPFENSELKQKMEELSGNLQKKDVPKPAKAEGEKESVLVVDDSGVMLRTIMGWLEPKFNVALANCAAAALTSVRRSKPDLILLDYEMPMYSGAELLEMLRNDEDSKDVPVIFLTSKGDADTVQEVLALKPQGYLLKTTPPEKIIQNIEDFFAKQSNPN